MTRKKKESKVVRKERPMHREIQKRYNKAYPVDLRSVPLQTDRWNSICDVMIEEFTVEGLTSTVELIKQCKK